MLVVSPHFTWLCFCELGGTITLPKLEEIVLCMVAPCEDFVCLVTLAGWSCGWHELEFRGHSILALPWEDGWSWRRCVLGWFQGSLCRGCPGRADNEVGECQGGLYALLQRTPWQDSWSRYGLKDSGLFHTVGTLAGQLYEMDMGWGATAFSVQGLCWQGDWSQS